MVVFFLSICNSFSSFYFFTSKPVFSVMQFFLLIFLFYASLYHSHQPTICLVFFSFRTTCTELSRCCSKLYIGVAIIVMISGCVHWIWMNHLVTCGDDLSGLRDADIFDVLTVGYCCCNLIYRRYPLLSHNLQGKEITKARQEVSYRI